MYELPNELHLQELIGQVVSLVSIGPYDVQIAFEKGLVIQAQNKLEAEIDGKRSLWFDGVWVSTTDVIHVLNKEVIDISNVSELILKIPFTGDVSLLFHTEVSQYECINITRGDGSIDVI